MKILVTGGSGLLGKSLQKIKPEYIYLSKNNGDLRNSQAVGEILDAEKPDKIIHAAAIVGGIQDNVRFPYTYFADNVLINANVVDAAVKRQIPMVAVSSTCVFPRESDVYPMTEEQALTGEPEPTNYGYALSKRLMQIQLETARKQFDYQFALLFLANLYGADDHYENESKAHLVTALIKKMHRAKTDGAPTVELLGTGKPLRQFFYALDAARAIIEIAENATFDVFNIAPDENLSVREIAEIAREAIGYDGELIFNGNLDGVFRKDAANSKLKKHLPDFKFLPLREGICQTYQTVRERI